MRRDPSGLRRELARVAGRQAGHFTAAQALEVGYAYPTQRYHTLKGDWSRVGRGIYRLPEWPPSQHEDLVRWTLWSRGRGVISHQTALAVHELGDVMPARVDLTVPPGFRARAPEVVLHLGILDDDDIDRFEGFSVTTPMRSILDCAATGMEVDYLAGAIRESVDRGLLTPGSLRSRVDSFGPAAAIAAERALGQEGL